MPSSGPDERKAKRRQNALLAITVVIGAVAAWGLGEGLLYLKGIPAACL